MSMKRRIASLVLALTMAGSMAMAVQAEEGDFSLPDELVYRIGFVNIDNADPNCYPAALNFKEAVESEEFAKEIGADKVEVMIADSALDIEKQSTNVETLLTKGVDMIFLIGVDTEGNTAAVETCMAEGVPVFMVGTEASGGTWKFIGFDEYDFGYTQGKWAADNLPEGAKICILEGTPGREASVKRLEGAQAAIAEREDLEVLSTQPGNFDAADSMQVTEDWITNFGDDIDCIIAADDKSASGAAEALASNDMQDSVAVVSCVTAAEQTENIKDGSWDAAVVCYWPSIGYLCADIAKDMYLGNEVPERSNIELYAMDADNCEELTAQVFGE